MYDDPDPDGSRREGVAARSVRLADGKPWGLALPTIRYSPRFISSRDPFGCSSRRVELKTWHGYPVDVEQKITELYRALSEGTARHRHEAFTGLAIVLLTRAHDISIMQANHLITVPENVIPEFVRDVLAVISTPIESRLIESNEVDAHEQPKSNRALSRCG